LPFENFEYRGDLFVGQFELFFELPNPLICGFQLLFALVLRDHFLLERYQCGRIYQIFLGYGRTARKTRNLRPEHTNSPKRHCAPSRRPIVSHPEPA
jgi:hypothetical protein